MDGFLKGPDRRVTSNILLAIITILIAGFVLRVARSVFLPLLVAGFLAYLMDPLVTLLRRIRLPVVAGVVITAMVFLSVFLVFGFILYRSSLEFARLLPRYQSAFVNMIREMLLKIQEAADTLIGLEPLEELQRVPAGTIVLSALRSIAGLVVQFAIIFFFALLILVGKYGLARKLLRSFPRKEAKRIALVLLHIDRDLRKYVGVKSLASLLVGLGTGVCLAAFQVEFAIVLGFLTFILNFIPHLGSIISLVLPFLIAVIQFGSWVKPLWILAVLIVVDNLVAQLFEPKVLGLRLNLSVPMIFLSLLFWGWLWGAPGVLLAVPLTSSIKIVFEDIPGLRPFALLLEKAPKKKLGR